MSMGKMRQALITSVVSLALCCAMLAGTTYAWFTESVSSEVQTIQSGNLDVQLSYRRSLEEDWKEITCEDDINTLFPDKIWEAGEVEYLFLEVTNTGNLPVSYQLTVVEEAALPAAGLCGAATPSVAAAGAPDSGESSGELDWLWAGCIRGEWFKENAYQTVVLSDAGMMELAETDGGSCTIQDGFQFSGELDAEVGAREVVTLMVYMPYTEEVSLLDTEADEEMEAKRGRFQVHFSATQYGHVLSEESLGNDMDGVEMDGPGVIRDDKEAEGT